MLATRRGAPARRGTGSVYPGDVVFHRITLAFASIVLLTAIVLVGSIVKQAWLALHTVGLTIFSSGEWNPTRGSFGALPFIYGTLASSLLALLLAGIVGIMVAVFLTEMASPLVRRFVGFLVEMLAAVPSIIFGLWGIYVLIPLLVPVQGWLNTRLGFIPLFSGSPSPNGNILTAGLVLAIMILPTIAAIARDVMAAVPGSQREGMLALGATRWETVRFVVLPYTRTALIGALILGLGRAIGETMAVTMVIGNTPTISPSLLSSGYSIAAVLANESGEAFGNPLHISVLFELGLVLLLISVLLSVLARVLVWQLRSSGQRGGSAAKRRGPSATVALDAEEPKRLVDGLVMTPVPLVVDPAGRFEGDTGAGHSVGATASSAALTLVATWRSAPAQHQAATAGGGQTGQLSRWDNGYGRRAMVNRGALGFSVLCTAIALIPLLAITVYVVVQGVSSLNLDFFTHAQSDMDASGFGIPRGIGNTIVGSLLLVVLACLMGWPIGLLSGIYLAEYGRGWFADAVRGVADVMAGLPSIVAGLVGYALIVPITGFSALAGGFALGLLMFPVVTRATEEVVRLVPNSLREGGLALGLPRWRVIALIVMPTAAGGILTSLLLGLARVTGETAPLLFTSFAYPYWQFNPLRPVGALTYTIYDYATNQPNPKLHQMAFAGALVLVGIVVALNLAARLLFRQQVQGRT